ncbi:MAG: sigma-54 dependent transcriptional regulator [Planctomycetaceae bacterium]
MSHRIDQTPTQADVHQHRDVERACDDSNAILRSIHDLTSLLDSDDASDCDAPVARSGIMCRLLERAKRYAASSATVLLEGESGTGKELIARLIHQHSPRSKQPYVRVNCAALAESLIESELFGHERGAFTGAVECRAGKFECADGGMLLLDEISEIPTHVQAKLLRVLEEAEYQRVGGNKTCHANVRMVVATNRSLEQEVANGCFRADLYYRLNILRLRLPALRERKEDIPPLVSHFVSRLQCEASVPIRGVAPETMDMLIRYDWPGNVRQLRNAIHGACVLNTSGIIMSADIPPLPTCSSELPTGFDDMRMEDVERHVILSALRRFNNNKTAAASHLGLSARTLLNKTKHYQQQGHL